MKARNPFRRRSVPASEPARPPAPMPITPAAVRHYGLSERYTDLQDTGAGYVDYWQSQGYGCDECKAYRAEHPDAPHARKATTKRISPIIGRNLWLCRPHAAMWRYLDDRPYDPRRSRHASDDGTQPRDWQAATAKLAEEYAWYTDLIRQANP